MVLAFPYFPTPIGGILKPIIPQVFINRNDPSDLVSYGTLVDSGADFTTISRLLAERLELDISGKKTKTAGIGGSADIVLTDCEIILTRGSEAYQMKIPLQVVLDEDDVLPYPLLGRTGIFRYFDITFRERLPRVDFAVKDKAVPKVPLPDPLKP